MAERTGLVVPIGRWVLDESCRRAKEWQERYPKDAPLTMAVYILHESFCLGLTRESLDIYTRFRFRVRHAESGEGRRCAGKVVVRSDVRRSTGRLGNV